MNVLVVRHAESVWNRDGRWQGQADPPLSSAGAAQARAAAAAPRQHRLHRHERPRTSPIHRRDHRRCARCRDRWIVDDRWRERDVGRWQGLTVDQIERDYPGALASGDRPPGWESSESMLDRILAAVHDTAARAPSGEVLVVSHAGVVYTLEAHFGCEFERIANLGGRRLQVQSGEVRLQERIALTGDGACLRPTATAERR